MLLVDLSDRRHDLFQNIRSFCSEFGEVRSVTIFLESSPTAVVEMSTIEQTEKLALTLGGKLVGDSVYIDLAQRPHLQ